MNPHNTPPVSNHKMYRESFGLRRAGTLPTDRAQPAPLGASGSHNAVPEVAGMNANPKRYSSLRIRLRTRWGSENAHPSTTARTSSSSSSSALICNQKGDSPASNCYHLEETTSRRLKRQSEAANLNDKPLPEIMIRFSFKEAPKTTRGVPMEWLVNPKVNTEAIESCMKGGADRVLDGAEGAKILLRIIWMPYVADMWYRIPILNDYSNPITRAELAQRVARAYQGFMESHKHDPFPDDKRYRCFKIGGPGMALCDMLLHSLTRLSRNEWEAKVNHAGF